MILDETRRLLLRAALGEGEQAVAAYRSWRSRVAFQDIDLSAFRVLGQLFRTANQLEADAPEIALMRGALKQTWINNMLRARALAAAIAAIDRAGIDVLVINGAALFARFPDLGKVHVADDFDMLVRERDRIRAMNSLTSAGFRLPVGFLDSSQPESFRYIHAFVRENGMVEASVDLHWWPLPGWTRNELVDELFAGRESGHFAGREVMIPALAEHLCLALAPPDLQDQDEVFARVIEVAHIVREGNGVLDWSRLIRLCRRFHHGHTAQALLCLIRNEIGVEIPDRVLKQLRLIGEQALGASSPPS